MINYNVNNKEYLLSIKPSYMFIPISLLISTIIIIISICYYKTYDVYNTIGFITCEEKCNISIVVNANEIKRFNNTDYIKLNDKIINYNNIIMGDIQVDEVNKINIQYVNIEVDQLDNDLINTFQDIKVYSNYENILYKIKKTML